MGRHKALKSVKIFAKSNNECSVIDIIKRNYSVFHVKKAQVIAGELNRATEMALFTTEGK